MIRSPSPSEISKNEFVDEDLAALRKEVRRMELEAVNSLRAAQHKANEGKQQLRRVTGDVAKLEL